MKKDLSREELERLSQLPLAVLVNESPIAVDRLLKLLRDEGLIEARKFGPQGKHSERPHKEELEAVKHLTYAAIGARYGVTRQRAQQWFLDEGIEKPALDRRAKEPPVSKEELEARKTQHWIKDAQEFGARHKTLVRWYAYYGIDASKKAQHHAHITKEAVEELKDLPIGKVAEALGCHTSTARRAFSRFGVARKKGIGTGGSRGRGRKPSRSAPPDEELAAFKSAYAAALHYGVCRATAGKWMKSYRERKSGDEV